MLCPTVHRTSLRGMDILAQVLDRVRLGGTLLFHFELGHPWNLALPERPYALFHYLIPNLGNCDSLTIPKSVSL
jgi:hypothetical protein